MTTDLDNLYPATIIQLDFDKPDHQEFMVRLDRILEKNNLPKLSVRRHSGLWYELVTDEYTVYSYAKELYLRMTSFEQKTLPYF